MRLLYFTRGYTLHDRRFLQAFRNYGVEAGYLALHDATAAARRLPIPAGVKVLGHLGVPGDPSGAQLDAAVAAFARISSRFAPDLVLAGPLPDCGYIAANAKPSCPWVAQSWAFDVFWENQQSSEAAQRAHIALRSCSALFADCEAVVAQCEKIADQSMRSRFIMPWGIDLAEARRPRSRKVIRREWGIEGRYVFLHTRGLEAVYAVETLLEAFRNFHRTHPAALLVLASDGSLRSLVERFISSHALHDAVMLTGAVSHDRALGLFCAADCYVSCSVSDGTSVSLLEAMAAGLPAIVNDRGGNGEWISDGENGWIVPSGDAGRLMLAMSTAASLSPQKRRRMAEENRHRVALRADWVGNFARYLGFLESCVQCAKPSSH